ncbi:MAG: ATP-dependent Clp protease proteolytic subunit [Deltaproteobacteria bacterium]|nr:ATP-dependent Clp protease proteolytic subunit [Deltaproteobacteria bacterium]
MSERGHGRLQEDDEGEAVVSPLASGLLSPYTPTLYLHGELNAVVARQFVEAVEVLTYERKVSAAVIDIATDGGDYFAVSVILSAIAGSSIAFSTYASGQAYSAGALVLSAGKRGARFISPYGAAMIHGMLIAVSPQGVEDAAGQARFDERLNESMMSTFAKNCGMTRTELVERIAKTGGRCLWLTPEDALAIQLVDHIGIPHITSETQFGVAGVEV